MKLIILFLTISAVFGGPLTQEENEKLQKSCGQIGTKSRVTRAARPGTRTEAPFTVLLHSSLKDGTPKERLASAEGVCTGTIISPRHILTAGHCIAFFNCKDNGSDIIVEPLGYQDRQRFRQKLNYLFVSASTNCEDKKECDSVLENLIAKPKRAFMAINVINSYCGPDSDKRGSVVVMELEEDLPFSNNVQPACLYTKEVKTGTTLNWYGYGNVNKMDKVSAGVMEKHSARTISTEECLNKAMFADSNMAPRHRTIPREQRLKSDELCINNEERLACGANGGSGMILRNNGTTYVAAIHGGGPSCVGNIEEYLTLTARLPLHLDWICAVSGVCPRGQLTEEQKAKAKEEYYTMEAEEIFPSVQVP